MKKVSWIQLCRINWALLKRQTLLNEKQRAALISARLN